MLGIPNTRLSTHQFIQFPHRTCLSLLIHDVDLQTPRKSDQFESWAERMNDSGSEVYGLKQLEGL